MKRRKTIIAAVVLLLLLLTGGVLAYFTDTKETTNTFTLGNVKIDLTEPSWNADNAQGIVPGVEVAKDPTITNTGNNNAYVFAEVDVPCLGNKVLFTYQLNGGWTALEENACASGVAKRVYYYGDGSLTALGKTEVTPAVFSSVTLVDLSNDEAGELTGNIDMPVKAYGIQADGLDTTDPAEIFANFS